ncbi:MAG: hypothetical protein ABI632_04650 [Pseudolysinimonas sp.]
MPRVRQSLVATAIVVTLAIVRPVAQAPLRPAPLASDGQRFQQALTLMDARRDYLAAARLFEQVAAGPDRSLASRALVYAGACYERLGRAEATRVYQRVLTDYADQRSAVREARARLRGLSRASRPGGPPMVTLRQAWTDRPPAVTGFGHASAGTRAIVTPLEGADEPVGLVDTATGRLLAARFTLNPAAPGKERPCVSTIAGAPSPDQRELAYTCEMVAGGRQELRVAALDGATRVLLRTEPEQVVNVWQWTTGGDIVVTLKDASLRPVLVLVSARNGRERRGLTLSGMPRSLFVAPDGRSVVYDGPSAGGNDDDVYIAPLPDGPAAVLLGGAANDVLPVWTPDGTHVLFVSDRTGTSSLWMVAVRDGRTAGDAQVLQQDIGRVVDPFGVTSVGAYYYYRQLGFPDVYAVALDGSGRAIGPAAPLSRAYAGTNMNPAWSPDGTRVAFVAQLGYSSRRVIAVRDLRGETQSSLQTGFAWIFGLRWSPDGRRLLVKGRDGSGRYGLHTVDVATGEQSQLLSLAPNVEDELGEAEWSASGRSVVYVRDPHRSDTVAEIHALDPEESNDRVMLTLPRGSWLAPGPGLAISRETGAFALALYTDSVGDGGATGSEVVVRAPDGSMGTVLKTTAPDFVYGVGWLPDGRTLMLLRANEIGNARATRLWRLDTVSAMATDLGLGAPAMRDLRVSPDGRAVAFTAGQLSRHVWVLENFLPAVPAASPPSSLRSVKP